MRQTACGDARARFLCSVLVAAALGAFGMGAPPRLAAQQTSGPAPPRGLRPANTEESTPAPLYRDPTYDGAADPTLIWNPTRNAWWMLYTQRRAKLDLPGVEWCHGIEIGVAPLDEPPTPYRPFPCIVLPLIDGLPTFRYTPSWPELRIVQLVIVG